MPLVIVLQTPEGELPVPCHRVLARLGGIPPRPFVEKIGIEFPNAKPDAVPELTSAYETNVPGHALTQLGHPWGGGSLPLWFEDDHRVRNCRQLTSFTNRPMFEGVIELHKHYEDNIKQLPVAEQEQALSEIAEGMQPGEPPRENMLIHRCIDQVVGTGTAAQRTVILRSGPAYLQTGIYQAAVANKLINEGTNTAGFVSPCQVAGHRYLLGQLKNFMPAELEIL